MHIPDGFLSAPVAITTAILTLGSLAYAVHDIKKNLTENKVPFLGLAAAFIFAAQMLNFPVAAGTSGHLVGAALAAILLGPSAAMLVMSAVLILQCLMFADGGITALGGNLFNLAVIAPFISYYTYQFILKLSRSHTVFTQLFAVMCASWLSVVTASIFCALELAASNVASFTLVLPAMTSVHMVIALGEAAITAFVVLNIIKIRPDLIKQDNNTSGTSSIKHFLIVGLIISLALAIFVSPFASEHPDGLEFVAEHMGFISNAHTVFNHAPFPDYSMMGMESTTISIVIVGLCGTLAAFIFSWFFAQWLSRAKNNTP